ncbi:MAG: aminopeptidase, partial [Chitinophagaceae bacterium]
IWRKNENKVTKLFLTNKKATKIQLDPLRETADINEANNNWPANVEPSKFSLFKSGAGRGRGQSNGINPMQNAMQKSK